MDYIRRFSFSSAKKPSVAAKETAPTASAAAVPAVVVVQTASVEVDVVLSELLVDVLSVLVKKIVEHGQGCVVAVCNEGEFLDRLKGNLLRGVSARFTLELNKKEVLWGALVAVLCECREPLFGHEQLHELLSLASPQGEATVASAVLSQYPLHHRELLGALFVVCEVLMRTDERNLQVVKMLCPVLVESASPSLPFGSQQVFCILTAGACIALANEKAGFAQRTVGRPVIPISAVMWRKFFNIAEQPSSSSLQTVSSLSAVSFEEVENEATGKVTEAPVSSLATAVSPRTSINSVRLSIDGITPLDRTSSKKEQAEEEGEGDVVSMQKLKELFCKCRIFLNERVHEERDLDANDVADTTTLARYIQWKVSPSLAQIVLEYQSPPKSTSWEILLRLAGFREDDRGNMLLPIARSPHVRVTASALLQPPLPALTSSLKRNDSEESLMRLSDSDEERGATSEVRKKATHHASTSTSLTVTNDKEEPSVHGLRSSMQSNASRGKGLTVKIAEMTLDEDDEAELSLDSPASPPLSSHVQTHATYTPSKDRTVISSVVQALLLSESSDLDSSSESLGGILLPPSLTRSPLASSTTASGFSDGRTSKNMPLPLAPPFAAKEAESITLIEVFQSVDLQSETQTSLAIPTKTHPPKPVKDVGGMVGMVVATAPVTLQSHTTLPTTIGKRLDDAVSKAMAINAAAAASNKGKTFNNEEVEDAEAQQQGDDGIHFQQEARDRNSSLLQESVPRLKGDGTGLSSLLRSTTAISIQRRKQQSLAEEQNEDDESHSAKQLADAIARSKASLAITEQRFKDEASLAASMVRAATVEVSTEVQSLMEKHLKIQSVDVEQSAKEQYAATQRSIMEQQDEVSLVLEKWKGSASSSFAMRKSRREELAARKSKATAALLAKQDEQDEEEEEEQQQRVGLRKSGVSAIPTPTIFLSAPQALRTTSKAYFEYAGTAYSSAVQRKTSKGTWVNRFLVLSRDHNGAISLCLFTRKVQAAWGSVPLELKGLMNIVDVLNVSAEAKHAKSKGKEFTVTCATAVWILKCETPDFRLYWQAWLESAVSFVKSRRAMGGPSAETFEDEGEEERSYLDDAEQ